MRIGSLFTGYGGLELGVQAALCGTVAWHSEIDPGASKILAHHWPDIPNLGDITAVDWSTVEPVDVLTGGFPCQDLSTAGIRKGLRPGTRSGLWAHMATAIDQLHPLLVVIENVRGLLSAEAHCDLERDCWCVGDERESPLRALGAVLGDLADLGYDTQWAGVRASDVGAPHQRFRVFIVAHPADTDEQHGHRDGDAWPGWWAEPADRSSPPADADLEGLEGRRPQNALARDFGAYAPAVARWEQITRRAAPDPTTRGRLNPAFVEWMMGLPSGHVTNTPGLSHANQLKALGNGVVPQQATLALRCLL